MKKYLLPLLAQCAACFLVALAAVLLKPVRLIYLCLTWVLIPLTGGTSAFLLVKRHINPYAAWILPCPTLALAYLLITRGLYLPNGWSMLLDVFISVMGAAAGDEYMKRIKRSNTRR